MISQISNWYLEEWNIPIEKTHSKLELVANDPTQFQVIMFVDRNPVSTGGVYQHVGLLDVKPQFKIYKHWLGLVYTDSHFRRRGFGALLCEHIESLAKDRGIMNLYLFSDTAVGLYKRLGWEELETVGYGNRMVTVMGKELD
ncbi:GNAT family N-acetyltransferase [Leptospira bouyouniensis]|uniref:N-acetyltransferase n=1 Tax=Leptospira bouyouniensis TaxID=2484911 RepID=A0ABY2L7Z8_9LEPT|nr:GNAT family N-acetyltransferase [Leptospira bouyouniensis]TGK52770.1 N-acetyltransferase [Leptospira bouyouniensis]